VRGRLRACLCIALWLAAPAAWAAEGAEGSASRRDSDVAPAAVTVRQRFAHVDMPARDLAQVAQIGERLVYGIKWKGLAAGQATLSVNRKTSVSGRPTYYLSLETASNDFLSTFYHVEDRVRSYVDADTGRSVLYVRDLREGGSTANDYVQFDYDRNLQYYRPVRTEVQETRAPQPPPRPIPGPVQDPLSVVYYLRHFSLEPGETREIAVGRRGKTALLEVTAKHVDRISLPGLGEFEALVVELEDSAAGGPYAPNLFVARGATRVWVERHTRIPLMARTSLPKIGAVEVLLHHAANCPLADHALSD